MPLIHPDDRGRIQEGIERALKEGTDEGLEYRIVRPDGSIRTLFARAEFADGTDEAFSILIGFVQDITERKQAGEALRQREAELTHVARLSTLGEMVAGIAHELGQPLYAIANYTDACTSELMSRQFEASDKLPEWIEGIDEAVKRASTVVKQLKQFASRGGMAPRRLQVDRDQLGLDEVIAESIELLNFELRRNNVKVALEPKPDGSGLEVNVERIPIQQVLVNLVRNASDAMMETPETDRRVVIHVFDRVDTAEIAVEDRGTGISEHNAERVFDAFFTTKAAGMGMGLAISRRIDL